MAGISRRERDTILQALRAGVVPRLGVRHLQVGRNREVEALVRDIERIVEGGAAIRFVVGEYGSGKTFFLNLVRLIALEKGLVVMSADLAPDRRLFATGGQARALYAQMTRNLSTRTRPDGGALANVVERFVGEARREAEAAGKDTGQVIRERLAHFEEHVGGFDFATVIRRYWEGHEAGDDELKTAALRWLRGEFATRVDARRALDVRTIVDDGGVYDHLKLMSAFVRAAGYKGLLVSLDEMVNLYKLASARARNANYEQILRILNDVLQGDAEHIGFIMGGTPEFVANPRRGLFSYEALQTRLAGNAFLEGDLVDFSGPVLPLANLTQEELFVLLGKINAIVQPNGKALPDEAITAFMAHCARRIGEAYFRTPRNVVTAFVNMLAVLDQNPGTDWHDLVERVEIGRDDGDDMNDIEDAPDAAPRGRDEGEDEAFESFRL